MAESEVRHPEYQYLDLARHIMDNGIERPVHGTEGRTIKGIFGYQTRYDLSKGFPLLTTKKVFYEGIIHELVWFLKGQTNVKYLADRGVGIWDEWAHKRYNGAVRKGKEKPLSQKDFVQKIKESDANSEFVVKWGDLGPIYGKMWRDWPMAGGGGIDQLGWAIDKLKDPKERYRKHICVSAWNPEYIYEMADAGKSVALPPCHTFFQFDVENDRLSCQLYQRSADLFLGVPFNIASYALLTAAIAQVTGLKPGEFVHTFGNVHIYNNHYEQMREQLSREPRPFPHVKINPEKRSIDDFVFEDFEVIGYDPHPRLKGEVTVVGGFDESKAGAHRRESLPLAASVRISGAEGGQEDIHGR